MSQLLEGWRCGLPTGGRSSCPPDLGVDSSKASLYRVVGNPAQTNTHLSNLPPIGLLSHGCCSWGQSWLKKNSFLFCISLLLVYEIKTGDLKNIEKICLTLLVYCWPKFQAMGQGFLTDRDLLLYLISLLYSGYLFTKLLYLPFFSLYSLLIIILFAIVITYIQKMAKKQIYTHVFF